MSRSRLARAALCSALVLLTPLSGFAHAILVASTPASGSVMRAGHVALTLRFNSRIDARRSRLILTRPDGTTAVLPIAAPPPRPDELTTSAELGEGAYSLRWQVLATDGHITRGDVPFTLVPGSPATANPAP